MVNARFPIDYYLDVFAARWLAWWYCTFHWQTVSLEQFDHDGKVIGIAVTNGAFWGSPQFRIIKTYYGKIVTPY